MGYDGRFTGAIMITPPIPVSHLSTGQRWFPFQGSDIALTIEDTTPLVVNPDGSVTVHRAATSVVAAMTVFSGYHLVEHLQRIVDEYGGGHAFTGRIECVGPEGDMWGVVVDDGRAVQVRPQIVWPGEGQA